MDLLESFNQEKSILSQTLGVVVVLTAQFLNLRAILIFWILLAKLANAP